MVGNLLEKLTQKRVFRVDNWQNRARHYVVQGQREAFPSITNILDVVGKPALAQWQIKKALEHVEGALLEREGQPMTEWDIMRLVSEAEAAPDRIRESAADFGTRSHAMLESIIRGEPCNIPADLKPVLDGFCQWKDQSGITVKWVELPVYSTRYGYAGSIDAIGLRSNQLIAIDWKTSNHIWPSYAMQVAAYANAITEMSGLPVTEAWAVRLGKNRAEFESRRVKDIEATFSGFLGALSLWRVLNGEVWR